MNRHAPASGPLRRQIGLLHEDASEKTFSHDRCQYEKTFSHRTNAFFEIRPARSIPAYVTRNFLRKE
ncbi:hypothetical protein SAMCFNEI73_pC1282 (plasmid) [Sinorhizobium americanum]|uniref:Uncharacterized protein n=1 Tax=Sinorhizobium americanum TaxID=194963 RepID=A0A1L3LY14_9HYPH|nr:hypothetical protein SAMCFNEI73_pC1282 [Sinorhizobium americanum]